MVVFDANFLIYFLDAHLKGSVGKNARVDYLVQQIQDRKEQIVIPTPALSELLVKAGHAAPSYLDLISRSRFFKVEPFSQRAAIECAALITKVMQKSGADNTPIETRAKSKFDQQILAISLITNSSAIYTNDRHLANSAKAAGLEAYSLDDLPQPPVDPQISLDLEPTETDVSEISDQDDD